MKLLLADDSRFDRALAREPLERLGYSIVEANDGDEALAILSADDGPQIAILDWMMPKRSGVDVCKALRARARQDYVFLIILTVRDQYDDLFASLEAGADEFLVKPLNLPELRARLRTAERLIALHAELNDRIRQIEHQNAELQQRISQIKHLHGLLPICASCKKVRSDEGAWEEIEHYVMDHSDAEFSHGICPSCLRDKYPEFADEIDAQRSGDSVAPSETESASVDDAT